MVSPAASAAKEVTASSAEKSWREAATQAAAAAESSGSSQPPQASPQLQFEVVYVPSTADACKAVQRALTELRSVSGLAFELFIASAEEQQWPSPPELFACNIPCLLSRQPTLR